MAEISEKRRRIEAENALTELQIEYTNLVIQHELVKKALNNAEKLLAEDNEEYFSDLSYSDSEGATTQYERLRAEFHELKTEFEDQQEAFQKYREDTEQDFAIEQDQKERMEKLEEDLLCSQNQNRELRSRLHNLQDRSENEKFYKERFKEVTEDLIRSKSIIEVEKRNNTILSSKIEILKNVKHECLCDCCEYDEDHQRDKKELSENTLQNSLLKIEDLSLQLKMANVESEALREEVFRLRIDNEIKSTELEVFKTKDFSRRETCDNAVIFDAE
ncbi:Oidioi.mRNA.OKI2018_I69.chr1.g597.t1.cds [Oikopleura dioica]|uniref:Oidioi.mRNA.OKI2018_I69.chr1.g597.t1.cds n=1 Tax=Oikopleura dioica TaxID=34765 RepID=A0ABN7SPP5_OIKDI|nr:Oidioi.mRNA.OKI2018_I69.chr1.g597.t1.cds [Oikopleura dioica]